VTCHPSELSQTLERREMKPDKYEQEIENSISEYKSVSDKKRDKINNLIKKAKEKKSVNLRVNSQDLDLLKLCGRNFKSLPSM
jgi:predicted DNA binding CopG/RHH family protein